MGVQLIAIEADGKAVAGLGDALVKATGGGHGGQLALHGRVGRDAQGLELCVRAGGATVGHSGVWERGEGERAGKGGGGG